MTMTNINEMAKTAETAAAKVAAKDWDSTKAADLWAELIAPDNRKAIERARSIVAAGRKRGMVGTFLWGADEFTSEEMKLFLAGCFSAWCHRVLVSAMKDALSDTNKQLESIAASLKKIGDSGDLSAMAQLAKQMSVTLPPLPAPAPIPAPAGAAPAPAGTAPTP